MTIALTIVAFISTLLGGVFGIKNRDKSHLILGFTAGVMLGVVAFDIFPEITQIINTQNIKPINPMIALVAGFLIFHVLEKSLLIHHAEEDAYGNHKHPTVGVASAIALIAHSFFDGVGIGLGFQISSFTGLLVALAVISHDFSDGLSTVSLLLTNKNTKSNTLRFLLLDALAPIAGGIFTLYIKIPQQLLVLYLGFFAGFLLYIGASDILPEAHREKSSYLTIVMTVLGVCFIFGVTKII